MIRILFTGVGRRIELLQAFRNAALVLNKELKIYGTEKTVTYDPQKRIGVCIDKIGTSTAISVGAYDFALAQLDA